MIIDKKYSLKPFGSGTSCIDCIDGECLRGLSLEECKEKCESSDSCNAGIHVDFTKQPIQSYCLPLNTINYKNRPMATSLISTENNGTFLSRENGVDISFIRNEKQFPSISETFDQLKSDIIFNYDIVNIITKDKSLQTFLPNTFFFQKNIITDFYMVIKGFDFSQGEITRIHDEDVVYFFYKETTLVLTYDFDKKQFLWSNFTDDIKENYSNVFHIQTKNKKDEFVDYIYNDSKVNIYTFHKKRKYYLHLKENYELGLKETEPVESLFISNNTDKNNIKKVPNEKLLDDRVNYMNKNMKVYLENFFPDKRNTIQTISFKEWNPVHSFLLFLIITLLLFCLLI